MSKKTSEENIELEDQEMVRMFKDDFDALQQEADRFAEENAQLVAENGKIKAHAEEMTAQAQRLQAEFDNYRKRTNETNKRVRQDGSIEVLEKILPVLDAIEQAKLMIKDEGTLGGIDIIDRQLAALLASFNVEKIDSLGMPFDPNLHNAVMEEEVPDDKKGTVVRVYQQGYKIGDRILRYAVVIVGK